MGRGADRARLPGAGSSGVGGRDTDRFDRDLLGGIALTRLGAKRSAWNAGDIRGVVEELIAADGVTAEPRVRTELTEDLAARAGRGPPGRC